jgi:hypothetical protein
MDVLVNMTLFTCTSSILLSLNVNHTSWQFWAIQLVLVLMYFHGFYRGGTNGK